MKEFWVEENELLCGTTRAKVGWEREEETMNILERWEIHVEREKVNNLKDE